MKSLVIKDLQISQEMTHEDLSAVRGGFVLGAQGGQTVGAASLLSIGSPVIAVNVPSMTALDIHPVTNIDLNLANIVASANTGVLQAKP